ncbi:MAG TPA: DHA2 family efflux MFS transporter permease subunit [Nitrolancea sp.]|nr:DHA2 family efflux MFS transporter permease subunit [Nitrolancea sp.]
MSQSRSNPWAILAVLVLGFFMILLDMTIVNIAIPSIITSLSAGLNQILWVINAYIMVYAVLLISAGRIGDIYGQRNLFAAGLVIFTIASAFCGLAQDTNQLIAARVIQGIGGALLTPQTLAILTGIFPPERRGAAFGVWGAVAGLGAVAGPTLGGIIVTNWSWRWIFYINVPLGIITLILTFLIIPDLRLGRRHRLDVVGVLLASAGLFGIVFGLIEGQPHDWGQFWGPVTIPSILIGSVVILIAFVIWEQFPEEPLIPLSLFKDRNFSLMNWANVVISFGMLGLFLPLTIYLQSVLGMSALTAGLTIAPLSLVTMVAAPVTGHLSDKYGGKHILIFGFTFFALGVGLITWLASVNSSWFTFLIPLLIAGAGMGSIFAPLSTIAMRDVTPPMAGAASGILNTTRQVGSAIGTAAVGAILETRLASALKEQAVVYSTQVPGDFRDRFVDAFSNAASGGLQVGPGQTGVAEHLPPDVPPQVIQQLQDLFHNVFAHAFVIAMRPSLVVAILVLVVGAVSCLALKHGRTETEPASPAESLVGERVI